MPILSTEPVSPQYIYVNPTNNLVHLLVPLFSDQEVGPEVGTAFKMFIVGDKALGELRDYKIALKLDIECLKEEDPQKKLKEERLVQINHYIDELEKMRSNDIPVLNELMETPAPPPFFMTRPNAMANGKAPKKVVIRQGEIVDSGVFVEPILVPNTPQSKTTLKKKVMIRNGEIIDSEELVAPILASNTPQSKVTPKKKVMIRNGEIIDSREPVEPIFAANTTQSKVARPTPKKKIIIRNAVIVDSEELDKPIISPVASASSDIKEETYRPARINPENFSPNKWLTLRQGVICADSDESILKNAYFASGGGFFNPQSTGRADPWVDDIKKLILEIRDRNLKSKGKFVMHKGFICTDFSLLVKSPSAPDYFAKVRDDFRTQSIATPPKNECVQCEMDVDIEELLLKIRDDEHFSKLPEEVQAACRRVPCFQLHTFLNYVATGRQSKAKELLTTSTNAQELLQAPRIFVDYSDRVFSCTAYEYAYWAKDIRMCLMLEEHMDDETRAKILERVNEMERIDSITGKPRGLVYLHHGIEHRSAHFSSMLLINAMKHYILAVGNQNEKKVLWDEIGRLQQDVPAHIAQEYSREDYPFSSSSFSQEKRSESLSFYNFITLKKGAWFAREPEKPVTVYHGSVSHTLLGTSEVAHPAIILSNFEALCRLEKARNNDLAMLYEHLNSSVNQRSCTIL